MNLAQLMQESQWVVATVNQPVVFDRTEGEAWMLNPNRRYILNAKCLEFIGPFLDSVSDLANSSLLRRLDARQGLNRAKILVERNRERGIGDLLFMTGPLAYLNHLGGNEVQIDMYAMSDRSAVLSNNWFLNRGAVLHGTLEYDALRGYNYHWFVDAVTECDSEPDQSNVYDALYRQIGLDPENVDKQWKRPFATVVQDDMLNLARFYRAILEHRKIDLSRIGYYVVAPFTNATLRSMDYTIWLNTIAALASRRPVVVVGNSSLRLPTTDMSAGAFIEHLSRMGGGVINAIDTTPIRVLMALVQKAVGVVCLDSGVLYIAQALNTPAVSLWGTHDPGLRIGYDERYMRLAVWNDTRCPATPCCAFSRFPVTKCPDGERQTTCAVLASVLPEQIIEKVDLIEKGN